MRAGRSWVWLVLAAVFSMHGLPYMAADTGHADMGSVHAQAPAWPETAAPALVPMLDDHPDSADGIVAVSSAPVTQESPAPGAAHAWAACLAVVVSGISLLVSWAVLRRSATSAGWGRTLAGPPTGSARAHRLRPPDLAALCLLRI
jgi:hypothetical protein